MLKRPYQNQDGTITMIELQKCKCSPSERRGPAGGVCWCGGAISEAHLTPLAVDMGQICPHCGGRGSSGFGETWLECERCNGTGQI